MEAYLNCNICVFEVILVSPIDHGETFFLKHVTRERAASRLQERVDVTGRKPVGGDGVAEAAGLETQIWYSPGQIVSAT